MHHRWLLFATFSLFAGAARAQTVDLASRRLLIEQAQSVSRAGDHAQAIELAQRALAMQSTPSLLLFLANEQLAMGRPHVAFNHAEQCVFDANRSSALPNREEVLRACRQVSQRVRDESAVLIVRADAVAGLAITIDGQAIAQEQIGVPMFVRAGARELRAEAAGYRAYTATIESTARQTIEHRVSIERVAAVATTETTSQTREPIVTRAASEPTVTRAPRTTALVQRRPSLAGPIALTATGGALALSAIPLFLLRNSALDGCAIEGDTVVCATQSAADRVPTARALGAASIGVLAGGAALATAGVVWWIVAANRRESTPVVAVGPGSITVAGVWR